MRVDTRKCKRLLGITAAGCTETPARAASPADGPGAPLPELTLAAWRVSGAVVTMHRDRRYNAGLTRRQRAGIDFASASPAALVIACRPVRRLRIHFHCDGQDMPPFRHVLTRAFGRPQTHPGDSGAHGTRHRGACRQDQLVIGACVTTRRKTSTRRAS
jgi:hypothetical protein